MELDVFPLETLTDATPLAIASSGDFLFVLTADQMYVSCFIDTCVQSLLRESLCVLVNMCVCTCMCFAARLTCIYVVIVLRLARVRRARPVEKCTDSDPPLPTWTPSPGSALLRFGCLGGCFLFY